LAEDQLFLGLEILHEELHLILDATWPDREFARKTDLLHHGLEDLAELFWLWMPAPGTSLGSSLPV
jgi:hypothetical protein